MSNMTWTKAQEEAIQARGVNILLSAAAGSGKTAVLAERILRRVTDPKEPVGINELLVLTFTRAAAAEMRTRIGKALAAALEKAAKTRDAAPTAANEAAVTYLKRQTALLGSASISTIDSFCQSLLRQYFYKLDLDPDFRILSDDNEIYLLRDSVLSEVLLTWYEKKDPHFQDCVDLFATRYEDAGLRSALLRLYSASLSMAFPEDFFRRLLRPYEVTDAKTPDDLPWAQDLLASFREKARSWADKYSRAFQMMDGEPAFKPYADQLSEEWASFRALIEGPLTWEAWRRTMNPSVFQRLKKYKEKAAADPETVKNTAEKITTLRKQVKTEYTALWDSYFSLSPEQWIADMKDTAPIVSVLSQLLIDFHRSYMAKKKEKGLLEFNDMEHYVLSLLLAPESTEEHPVQSETAWELSQRYKEVMVDEYQDTNSLQELITALISSGRNRFLVGDIKQSIYRFRQADPGIFLAKYQSYPGKDDARRIDLNWNFRSDVAILSAVNFIFAQILQKDPSGKAPLELVYGPSEALYPGRQGEPAPPSYAGGTVSIDLIDLPKTKDGDKETDNAADIDNMEIEARLIASRIHTLMESGTEVMNKDGTYRPLGYGDIAILLRSVETRGPILLQALREEDIPARCDQTDDFLGTIEIQLLWAFLKIIDNPRQDLALTAVLRSPFTGLSESALALLRLKDKRSLWDAIQSSSEILSGADAMACIHFKSQYRKWRALSRQSGTAPLIEAVLDDTDYLSYLSGMPGSAFRQDHVLAFYDMARTWDSDIAGGLNRFLENLQKIDDKKRALRLPLPASSEAGTVQIMTIHKSKGLEFPIVFLSAAGARFNKKDLSQIALLHKEKGLGLYHFDRDRLLRWPTLYSCAIREDIRRASLAEEARLLYVAMTRARDKLFITGTMKNMNASLASLLSASGGSGTIPTYAASAASSYLDWILPAAARSRSAEALWDAAGLIPSYRDDNQGVSFTFTTHKKEEFLREEEQKDAGTEAQETPPGLPAWLTAKSTPPVWIEEHFRWRYPYRQASQTPAKLTATAAVKLAEPEKEEAMPSALLAAPIEEKQSLPADFAAPPAFLASEQDAYRGTAYGTLMHKAMELLDFHILEENPAAIAAAIGALSKKHAFTEEEAGILLGTHKNRRPVDDILSFMKSTLGLLMRRAQIVRKEMAFSILLPAREFYPACENGEEIFLQGAIDCLLEKGGKLVIIDYKTDHVPDGQILADHYQRQLQIYGEAAETILQKPVAALYLWSFHLKEAVRVPFTSRFKK